ncbi:uncharacterized protein FRV6_14686 [Fusarium oxysporum]|uniref:Uncharacterized protein n=1 Tax=Fusarium oxysporum TaxID=5507 RepID=A0A2H3TPK1_FUSOX|nr:uncharacterized protein FRV6_14686 [Fusarium oxysporum]
MSAKHPLDGFPPFNPAYKSDEIDRLNREKDEAWNKAFRQAWTSWGHRLVPDERPEWEYWASRLYTNKRTDTLYNHQVGKAGPGIPSRPISWGNIAAVLSNPRWTKESIMKGSGLDWAKRAQKKFPNANIFKGQPNNDGPAITDTLPSSAKRTVHQSPQSSPTASSNPSAPNTSNDNVNIELAKYKARVEELEKQLEKEKLRSKDKERKLGQEVTLAKINSIELRDELKKTKDMMEGSNLTKERKEVMEKLKAAKSWKSKADELEAELQRANRALAMSQSEDFLTCLDYVDTIREELIDAQARLKELGQQCMADGRMTPAEFERLMDFDV